MARWVLLVVAFELALTGCASLNARRAPDRSTAELAHAGRERGLPLHDPLEFAPEHAAVIAEQVRRDGNEGERAHRLARWLKDTMPGFSYAEGESLTADEAWREQQGDCFAKTNLFVAAARQIGIEARYTYVREVGRYRERSGSFVVSSHVAAEYGHGPNPEVVDFERVPDERTLYTFQPITDLEAAALFNSNLAIQHLLHGRTHLAEGMLRFLIERSPELPELSSNLAVVLIQLGRPAQAREVLTEAISRSPTYPPLYTNAVAASLAMGDDASARDWENRGRSVANDDALFMLGQGLRRYTLHDYRGAAERFERATELQDDSSVAWAWLARARLAEGRVDAGRRAFTRARRLSPDDPRLRDLLQQAPQLGAE